jgi:endo-1,4-beta-xylanase
VNEAVCDAVRLTPSKQNCNATLGRAADAGLLKGGGKISAWYPDVPDYIDIAFETARSILGPSKVLVYNDYGFESTSDVADPNKHSRVYDWVRAALARGVPIDAVGFQFHIANIHNAEGILGATLYGGYMDGVKEQFDKIAALGVEVHVTEIDVGCNFPTLPCPAPWLNYAPGSRQLNQAEAFSRILQHCVNTPACKAYQMWGSTDKYSWRDGTWGNGGSLQSWYNQYAHPFDVNYQPKLAAYAMLGVLRAKQIANGYTPPN